jgi:hypothetical protein
MIRKIAFLVVMITLTLSYTAFASPFLVCDPYANDETKPTYFVVVLNGVSHNSPAVVLADGTVRLEFDLGGLWNAGGNNVTVKAVNIWGESQNVPFAFIAGLPSDPSHVVLE